MDMIQSVFVEMAGDQERRAGLGMADDEHVCAHGGQVVHGVEQGFALAGRGRCDIEVDDVGGQAFGRDFECRPGTGRIFEKEIEYALAAHQGHFLDFPVRDADE